MRSALLQSLIKSPIKSLVKPLIKPLIASCLLPLLLIAAGPVQAFSFDDVAQRAEELSRRAYEEPAQDLPEALANLDYDRYRQIRYRPERALWRGGVLPFEVQFFHPGLAFRQPVKVNVVGAKGAFEQRYLPEQFDFGKLPLDIEQLRGLHYAGLRVHYPVNTPGVFDESLMFQGASSFRALGKGQQYGQSARALAVDTALLSGEEFPLFREFWIIWPSPDADYLRIYALLDSRRVTGAYRFDVKPGTSTTLDVQARIYLRDGVGKLGMAPLSGMFFFGEHQPAPVEDYRPEVHDIDGLLLRNGNDEWLWRPVTNPRRLLVTSFAVDNPRGFGLLQRDRNFDHYQDLGARYELRPGTWVTPTGDWGKGRIELVQIPSPNETNDNVIAYFVRDVPPPVGQPFDFSYTLSWQMMQQVTPPTSQAVQTRRGEGFPRGSDGSIRMSVDFEGPALALLEPDTRLLAALSLSDNAELLQREVVRNQVTGGWRLSFRFRRKDETKPVEMRAALRNGDTPVSETWTYVLPGT